MLHRIAMTPSATPSQAQRERFLALLADLTPRLGRNETRWPGLCTYRAHRPTTPDCTVYTAALCIVGQGVKQARLGERLFRYDPFHYLVIGAPLPVRAQIVEATSEKPFLSLVLDIGVAEIRGLLREIDKLPLPAWSGAPPLRISALDDRLLDAATRLLEAVRDPLDCRVLAPAAVRELLYLALRRDQGDLLSLAARARGRLGVARALDYLHRNLERSVDVATLARTAGMSSRSLHDGFKSATALSPIQYLKRLRLDRARQLMLEDGCQASEAALRVGYESPSQFSREFRRVFGLPPRRYLARFERALPETALAAGREAVTMGVPD